MHGNPAIEIKLHAGANVVGGLMITDELERSAVISIIQKFIGYNALTNVSFWSSCHVMKDQVRAEIEMTPAGEVNFYLMCGFAITQLSQRDCSTAGMAI